VQIALNFRRLGIDIASQNEDAHHIIMLANHGELLVACKELQEQFPQGAKLVSQELAELGFPSNESAQLIGTNVPPAIQRLNPHEIIITSDSVSVKLRPLSRCTLLWSTDASKYSGNVHLTNGLWFYDVKQNEKKGQHAPPAGTPEAGRP